MTFSNDQQRSDSSDNAEHLQAQVEARGDRPLDGCERPLPLGLLAEPLLHLPAGRELALRRPIHFRESRRALMHALFPCILRPLPVLALFPAGNLPDELL